MKKAFTLVEILVVLIIVGILSAILLKSYTRVSEMSFRVQQTKNVHQEVLHLAQVMQNLADSATIDFAAYGSGMSLSAHEWITPILLLSGADGHMSLLASGDCQGMNFTGSCTLLLQNSGSTIVLTDPHKVYLKNLAFKIIPYASTDEYIENTKVDCKDYLHCLNKPGFWLLLDAYNVNYSTIWANKVHMPLQIFFTTL